MAPDTHATPDTAAEWNPASYESAWQQRWTATKAHAAPLRGDSNKAYVLDMFPYPSATGLHVGHWSGYVLTDTLARKAKMDGKTVLHPMGFDSFGLPAENYAIKTGTHPADTTEEAIANYQRQLQMMGAMYDWDREVVTSRPDYYKWTQWLFLKFYEKGLAYRSEAPVNWDPVEQTVLANEQVIDGRGERSGALVEKKMLTQWFFRTTAYAQELLDGLEQVQWPERIKTAQRNWIGRSEGAEVTFEVIAPDGEATGSHVTVFTTRVDTLFGVTFVTIAPEHPLLQQLPLAPDVRAQLEAYKKQIGSMNDIERQSTTREKTGMALGLDVRHPLTGETVPLWTGDYVLATYGTGAVMGVPAHDERDHTFAQKYGLHIKQVVQPADDNATDACFTDDGVLLDSQSFSGMPSAEARQAIAAELQQRGRGHSKVTYRLRDWLLSRQRYWGCPIPIIHCPHCGMVPVPAEQLPVVLPRDVKDWTPKGGVSPLATVDSFVNVACPTCGAAAKRETDTMDTFVDSSWYFLRFIDPHNEQQPWNRELADSWMPVDTYVGGIEHATLHLIYARFFAKVLADMDMLSCREPFTRLGNPLLITNNGAKMSKSKGNGVSPDDIIARYCTDALRTYILFMGPAGQEAEWTDNGVAGCYRWLGRVWSLQQIVGSETPETTVRALHQMLGKTNAGFANISMNTSVAAAMEATNAVMKGGSITKDDLLLLVRAIAPMAPHLAAEMAQRLAPGTDVFALGYPQADAAKAASTTATIVVQVLGRVRGSFEATPDTTQEEALAAALGLPRIADEYLGGKPPAKVIYVPGKLLSLVPQQ